MKSSNTNARSAASGSTEFSWKWRLSDLQDVPKNGLNVFSCFSCGGGSSMGYKLAGYDVVGCCEIDPAMMKLYRHNLHPKKPYLMDIRDLVDELDGGVPEEMRDLDVLDGSPPCSVFSLAGKREHGWGVEKTFREGQAEQRLDDLFLHFLNVAKKLQPKVIVAENVKGLIIGSAKGWVNQIVRVFDEIGYDVQVFLLNAARMGVPQDRKRVFFIGRRKDLEMPAIKLSFTQKEIPFREVRDEHGASLGSDSLMAKAIKYRQPSDVKMSQINARIRRTDSGYTTPINHDDKPVRTITANGYLIRMCDGLRMTDQDIINCQTFPQDYNFLDQGVQYVCGMSVPPVMMANVAREIDRQLFGGDHRGE